MNYRAVNKDGTIVEGQLDASGRQEVLRELEDKGLRPIEVSSSATAAPVSGGWKLSVSRGKVPFRVLEEFTRQLSSLLSAGVSLSRALSILHREASVPAAKTQWRAIHDAVVDGMPLAGAMAKHPRTFPRVYVAMVQAGETGGFLAPVLSQIADFQNRTREMRGKVISALIYPAVLLSIAILVVVFLMLFFVPRFQVMFKQFGADLPLITRIIVACSESAARYGLFAVAFIGLAFYWTNRWLRTEQGKRTWQRWVLRLPVIGSLQSRYAMSRFCRMLGTMLEAGVPLIAALRVGCESLGNQTLADALTQSIERVKKGSGLAASLRDCRSIFPGSVLEMIAVSEETGRLDKELIRVAVVTEADLDRRLRTAVSLLEPLMLLVMAGFVGTIFIGMVFPIFSLQDYIK